MSVASPTGTAGLLLTGGASRRMGRPKATIPGPDGQTLARRTAALLELEAAPALEMGPGFSGLPHVLEDPAGSGPLVAIACGWRALESAGWSGRVLVVATDLPRLTRGLLAWLARHPSPASLVPVSDGRPQPLCARYSVTDLRTAVDLVTTGARAMGALLDAIRPRLVDEEEWAPAAGDSGALADADTPSDLRFLQWESK
jgi:molybdenum cofactor guanylyltransferase